MCIIGFNLNDTHLCYDKSLTGYPTYYTNNIHYILKFEREIEEAAHFTASNVTICCVAMHVTLKALDQNTHRTIHKNTDTSSEDAISPISCISLFEALNELIAEVT